MKKKYILLLLLGFFGMNISAQTLTQAKALYEKGQYDQAKPALKKFVKSQPNNGSYNLWYGVCCLNTGEAEEAIKYLETAVKRRAAGGSFIWHRPIMPPTDLKMQSTLSKNILPN